MNEERKIKLRELLRTRAASDLYGDFVNISDGTYKTKFDNIYISNNSNDKEFIGLKSTIIEGQENNNFIVDCLYINDDAFDRSMQKIRNLLKEFLATDISEDDEIDTILEKLSLLKGREAYVTVKTNEGMKSYVYKTI